MKTRQSQNLASGHSTQGEWRPLGLTEDSLHTMGKVYLCSTAPTDRVRMAEVKWHQLLRNKEECKPIIFKV